MISSTALVIPSAASPPVVSGGGEAGAAEFAIALLVAGDPVGQGQKAAGPGKDMPASASRPVADLLSPSETALFDDAPAPGFSSPATAWPQATRSGFPVTLDGSADRDSGGRAPVAAVGWTAGESPASIDPDANPAPGVRPSVLAATLPMARDDAMPAADRPPPVASTALPDLAQADRTIDLDVPLESTPPHPSRDAGERIAAPPAATPKPPRPIAATPGTSSGRSAVVERQREPASPSPSRKKQGSSVANDVPAADVAARPASPGLEPVVPPLAALPSIPDAGTLPQPAPAEVATSPSPQQIASPRARAAASPPPLGGPGVDPAAVPSPAVVATRPAGAASAMSVGELLARRASAPTPPARVPATPADAGNPGQAEPSRDPAANAGLSTAFVPALTTAATRSPRRQAVAGEFDAAGPIDVSVRPRAADGRQQPIPVRGSPHADAVPAPARSPAPPGPPSRMAPAEPIQTAAYVEARPARAGGVAVPDTDPPVAAPAASPRSDLPSLEAAPPPVGIAPASLPAIASGDERPPGSTPDIPPPTASAPAPTLEIAPDDGPLRPGLAVGPSRSAAAPPAAMVRYPAPAAGVRIEAEPGARAAMPTEPQTLSPAPAAPEASPDDAAERDVPARVPPATVPPPAGNGLELAWQAGDRTPGVARSATSREPVPMATGTLAEPAPARSDASATASAPPGLADRGSSVGGAAAVAVRPPLAFADAPARPATIPAVEERPAPPSASATDRTTAAAPQPIAPNPANSLPATTIRPSLPHDGAGQARPPAAAPSAPVIQPAARAFAGGIAKALQVARSPGGNAPDDPTQPLVGVPGIGPQPLAPPAHPRDVVDLGHGRWPHAMIDRIETLRDAADAADTRIRLVPDALGPLDIAVRSEAGRVHVHFTAEAAATRSLLTEAQGRLAEIAEQRGLRLGQATVGDGGAGQREQRQAPPFASAPVAPAPAAATDTDTDTPGDDRIA